MPDLLFLLITITFFVAAAGLVTVCDRIIGPDPQVESRPEVGSDGDTDAGGDIQAADLVSSVEHR